MTQHRQFPHSLLPYASYLRPYARKLRKNATFPERLLWSRLRRKQLGVRFLRQQRVKRYILDFYCPEQRLAIEVDGRSHEGRFEEDQYRQRLIEELGIHFLRFTNDEVIQDLSAVVTRITHWLEGTEGAPRIPPPPPPYTAPP